MHTRPLPSFAAAFFLALLSVHCSKEIPEEELRQRADASELSWNNYQEEIKAQLGATPTAEWSGGPIRAERDGVDVRVTFQIDPPWSERLVAIPILARDPLGLVYRPGVEAQFGPEGVTYSFTLDNRWADSAVPSLEVQYPRHEVNIVFRPDGAWTRTESR